MIVLVPVRDDVSDLVSWLNRLMANVPPSAEVYVVDGRTASGESVEHARLHFLGRLQELSTDGSDLAIVDPEIDMGPGVLEEMSAVLDLHERHAIAVPRSNRPGFGQIPLTGPELSADQAVSVWNSLRTRLPRFQVIPAAEYGCVLIKSTMLNHFGMFGALEDAQTYSQRINRYGYSAVLANWAFVDAVADSPRARPNDELFEYIASDADPVDYFGSLAIPHRPRVLYDLFHLAPHYYGTADFALNLLRDLHFLARDEFDLYIDIQPAALDFFLPELQGYRIYRSDEMPALQFDLVFKPTQINSWEELDRINRLAPRVAYTIQDMIAVRCRYLSSPARPLLFRKAAELCNKVFTISRSVESDFAALTGSRIPLEVIHHGTNYGVSFGEQFVGSYVLLMGNSYAHKGLPEALRVLSGDTWPVVVLGASEPVEGKSARVRYLDSGALTRESVREILAGARVLVYPSHYEGFGLPVVDALALGKSVIVIDNETNRELAALTESRKLYRIARIEDLSNAIREVMESPLSLASSTPRPWRAAAEEYVRAFRELLRRDVDTDRLRARWDFLRARGL